MTDVYEGQDSEVPSWDGCMLQPRETVEQGTARETTLWILPAHGTGTF